MQVLLDTKQPQLLDMGVVDINGSGSGVVMLRCRPVHCELHVIRSANECKRNSRQTFALRIARDLHVNIGTTNDCY